MNKSGMLQIGDVIRLEHDKHWVYCHRAGRDYTEEIRPPTDEYVVIKTSHEGGGTGMGPHDIYPDGHHIYAKKLKE